MALTRQQTETFTQEICKPSLDPQARTDLVRNFYFAIRSWPLQANEFCSSPEFSAAISSALLLISLSSSSSSSPQNEHKVKVNGNDISNDAETAEFLTASLFFIVSNESKLLRDIDRITPFSTAEMSEAFIQTLKAFGKTHPSIIKTISQIISRLWLQEARWFSHQHPTKYDIRVAEQHFVKNRKMIEALISISLKYSVPPSANEENKETYLAALSQTLLFFETLFSTSATDIVTRGRIDDVVKMILSTTEKKTDKKDSLVDVFQLIVHPFVVNNLPSIISSASSSPKQQNAGGSSPKLLYEQLRISVSRIAQLLEDQQKATQKLRGAQTFFMSGDRLGEFHRSVREGNELETIRNFLKMYPQLKTQRDATGVSAIHHAVIYDRVSSLKILIEEFHVAVLPTRDEFVQLRKRIMEHESTLQSDNMDLLQLKDHLPLCYNLRGQSALELAASSPSMSCLKYLIEEVPEISQNLNQIISRNPLSGNTIGHFAATNEKVLRYLASKTNLRLDATNFDGDTLLKRNQGAIFVKTLLLDWEEQHPNKFSEQQEDFIFLINNKNKSGERKEKSPSPVSSPHSTNSPSPRENINAAATSSSPSASRNQKMEAEKKYHRDHYGSFHDAIRNGETPDFIRSYFLEPGGDDVEKFSPNSKFKDTTAMQAAVSKDRSAILQLLIRYGGDLTQKDPMNFTLLHLAAYHGAKECFKVLAETNRFDFLTKSITGSTILHDAILFKHHEIIACCISLPNIIITRSFAKQMLEAKGRNNLTPLEYAKSNREGKEKCIELLERWQNSIEKQELQEEEEKRRASSPSVSLPASPPVIIISTTNNRTSNLDPQSEELFQRLLSELPSSCVFDPDDVEVNLSYEGEIGAGSFGRVYEATVVSRRRLCAAKIAKPMFTDVAISEAKNCLGITHPQIVQMYGVTILPAASVGKKKRDAQVVILMELADRGSLRDVMNEMMNVKNSSSANGEANNNPSSPKSASSSTSTLTPFQRSPKFLEKIYFYALQIAAGLAYLHEPNPRLNKGRIYHLDLKPANVLAFANDIVKLCDFGTMKETDNTATSVIAVTPTYVPPEFSVAQLRGDRVYGTASYDVYAFAVILHEMLVNGNLPRLDKTEIARQMVKSNDNDNNSSSSSATTDIPESIASASLEKFREEFADQMSDEVSNSELVKVCRECLRVDPESRPANGTEVLEKLIIACKQDIPEFDLSSFSHMLRKIKKNRGGGGGAATNSETSRNASFENDDDDDKQQHDHHETLRIDMRDDDDFVTTTIATE